MSLFHPFTRQDKATTTMKSFNKPATARDALQFAKDDLIVAEDRLWDAQEDTAAAQRYVDTARKVIQKHDDFARRQTAASAEALRTSIKSGSTAVIEPPAPSSSRINAEDRLKVAELALAELQTDERVVAAVVDVSKAEVAKAVKEVVREEALRMADRINLLEAEANDLRCRLGFGAGYIAAKLYPMGEKLAKIIQHTEMMPEISTTNTPLFLKAKASGKVWAEFAGALACDPAATLKFA